MAEHPHSLTALDGAPPPAEAERLRRNRSAARAGETKRALWRNWNAFADWCAAAGIAPLPAAPEVVERYLVHLADAHPVRDRAGRLLRHGLKPAAVQQALWAINARHRMAGAPVPGDAAPVRIAMAGIRRRKGTRPKQQAPLTIAELRRVRFRDDLKGMRDRALLLLGFAGCLRRSELVGLDVADVVPAEHGLRLLVRRSKTDPEARGAWVDILAATHLRDACPVAALQDWLDAAGIREGPVFRSLTRGRAPRLGGRLSAVSVDALVKWAAAQCGLDPALYGGHSLRAGRATYLADQERSPALIARHGRWKSLDMVLTYYRGDVARGLRDSY